MTLPEIPRFDKTSLLISSVQPRAALKHAYIITVSKIWTKKSIWIGQYVSSHRLKCGSGRSFVNVDICFTNIQFFLKTCWNNFCNSSRTTMNKVNMKHTRALAHISLNRFENNEYSADMSCMWICIVLCKYFIRKKTQFRIRDRVFAIYFLFQINPPCCFFVNMGHSLMCWSPWVTLCWSKNSATKNVGAVRTFAISISTFPLEIQTEFR